jgi:hypothetical protein
MEQSDQGVDILLKAALFEKPNLASQLVAHQD